MKILVEVCSKCGEPNTLRDIGDDLVECNKCGDMMNKNDVLYKYEGGI